MYLANFRPLIVLLIVLSFAVIVPATRPVSQGDWIVSEAFTIDAGSYSYFEFSVPRNGRTVVGRFRASGGSGNDVEAFILDEDGFENFQNGHRVRTYYNSGRVTVGNINVFLDSGNYYLVFNNKFSVVSNKAVNARVSLRR